MTKEEAAQLLNVSANASQGEIQAKFQEMFNEYQIRLTNAPTPNLKKIYQSNLQELNTALSVLSGKTAAQVSDLPSSSPTYRQVEQQAPVQSQSIPTEIKPSQPLTKGPSKEKAKEKKGVPSSVITAIGIALVAIAATVFLVIKSFEDKGQINKLQLSADSVGLLQNDLGLYKGLFDNQKFKIKNDGEYDMEINTLIVTYWSEDHKLQKIEQLFDRTIRKGGSLNLEIVDGTRIFWDGSVVSYGVRFNYRGDSWVISGIYTNDMKPEDKTLHINIDPMY